jgi:hypothetical protein
MEVTLAENEPPVVQQPGGTLFDGGPQSGIRTLTYSAADPQSGLSRIDALVDDGVVASEDLTPRCPYSDLTVCPASDDGALQIDTRNVPNGTHSVAVRVRDAAGNERILRTPTAIEIANAPVPDTTEYRLTARFKGSSRSTLTVPYGRRVWLRGRMTSGSGPAPSGTRIDVLERLGRRGAREVSVAAARTAADGAFSYHLAPGPSRTLRLAYRPSGGGRDAFSPALRLRVRAASTLRASLRGLVLHFSGRVRSRPIPTGGKRLRMEGRAPGAAWKSFASPRTDRHGRFSGTYRLRVHRPGVRLKVRVVVPSGADYAYVTSRSRALTLRVR